jgi:hypothetical protein
MKNLKKLTALFGSRINEKALNVISNDEMAEICGGRPEAIANTNNYWWLDDSSIMPNNISTEFAA